MLRSLHAPSTRNDHARLRNVERPALRGLKVDNPRPHTARNGRGEELGPSGGLRSIRIEGVRPQGKDGRRCLESDPSYRLPTIDGPYSNEPTTVRLQMGHIGGEGGIDQSRHAGSEVLSERRRSKENRGVPV